MNASTRWNFADFELDATAGTLRKSGEPVKIGRQAFRALTLLVTRQGELVTREELQKEIWGDRVHVDFEHGLNVCIRQVRLALADDVEGNSIVVTCPREGYRLGVPAKAVVDTSTVETPVDDLPSTDPLAPRLLWDTRRRAIAIAASVAAAVAVGGALMWQTDAFSASSLQAVNGASGASGQPVAPTAFRRNWPTANSEAYAWYWRGRSYYDRATGRRPAWALPYFETAASLDPNFALAHASLTVSYLDRAATGFARKESIVKAKEAAERAVALGPELPETHVALAELSYRSDGDMAAAERAFKKAVELDDHSAYARQRYAAFLHDRKRFTEALEHLRVAKQLDPLSVMTNWQIANELYYSGQHEAAMAQANRTLEIDPSHAWSFRTLGQCLEAMGRLDEAIAAYLKAGQVALGHLGRAYAAAGRRAEARQLLETLMKRPADGTENNAVAIAFILTGLGEHAQAAEWLARMEREGVRLPFSLGVEPQWDAIRASRPPAEKDNGSGR